MATLPELSQDNPYADGIVFEYEDGSQELERNAYNYAISGLEKIHTVSEGETLEGIAYQYYRKMVNNPGRYVVLLAEVNQIDNPLNLSDLTGTQLIIPDVLKLL